MTILNRALDKAYKRRSSGAPAAPPTTSQPTANGWASQLREPVRPFVTAARAHDPSSTIAGVVDKPAMPTSARRPATPAPAPAIARTSVSPSPAGGPHVRVDAPHAPSASAAEPPVEKVQAPTKVEPVVRRVATGWAWPAIVDKLLASRVRNEIAKFAVDLKNLAVERGLGCIAVTGPGRASGRTALVLTLARLLSELPQTRITVVDADFTHPDAARLLALSPTAGLWEAASGDGKTQNAVQPLNSGRLSLVPLTKPVDLAAIDRAKIRNLHSFLRALRRDNEIVLVDAGPWESIVPPLIFESRAIDACICVCRAATSPDDRLDEEALRQPGVEMLGTIETFTHS